MLKFTAGVFTGWALVVYGIYKIIGPERSREIFVDTVVEAVKDIMEDVEGEGHRKTYPSGNSVPCFCSRNEDHPALARYSDYGGVRA